MTVGAQLRGRVAANDVALDVVLDIVDDHQVEESVPVVVEPARGGRPVALAADAGGLGDVDEGAVAVVPIEQ